MAPLLQMANVHKVFPGRSAVTAVKNLNISVQQGEFVAILGPSGCGKTTMLRLAAGLEFPTQGQVIFGGQPVQGPRRSRPLMFQEPRLFPWLTVEQNVAAAGPKEMARRVLGSMGLTEFAGSYPHELSGGMARRVALARALVGQPDILLLDEPLSNLDLPVRRGLQAELLRMWRQGLTCLLVTHELEEALVLASRILVLSPRPAKILWDGQIPLPYPRDRRSDAYLRTKQDIQKAMEGWSES